MTYHLNIIDHTVELPSDIDKEYNTIDEAYDALFYFVHSFDHKKDVCGRICSNDIDCTDVDYCTSL